MPINWKPFFVLISVRIVLKIRLFALNFYEAIVSPLRNLELGKVIIKLLIIFCEFQTNLRNEKYVFCETKTSELS